MTIIPAKSCKVITCTILRVLSELDQVTGFNNLIREIIGAKVEENQFFLHFSSTLATIISLTISLNPISQSDSDRTRRIVQINTLHSKMGIQSYKYLRSKLCTRFTPGGCYKALRLLEIGIQCKLYFTKNSKIDESKLIRSIEH